MGVTFTGCCFAATGRFNAFVVLSVDGVDLHGLPLLERKRRLLRVMPRVESRLLYLDHLASRGWICSARRCARDLGGVVAEWTRGAYQSAVPPGSRSRIPTIRKQSDVTSCSIAEPSKGALTYPVVRPSLVLR